MFEGNQNLRSETGFCKRPGRFPKDMACLFNLVTQIYHWAGYVPERNLVIDRHAMSLPALPLLLISTLTDPVGVVRFQ